MQLAALKENHAVIKTLPHERMVESIDGVSLILVKNLEEVNLDKIIQNRLNSFVVQKIFQWLNLR